MGYTKNAITGFGWRQFFYIAANLIAVLKMFFLARLLSPTEFGVFAIVAITLGLAEAFTQTGVNITILQSKRPIAYFINTAWVIAIVRGFLIGTAMIILGLALGRFYNQSQLTFLVAMATLVPITKGFINPSLVLLQKNLLYAKDSAFNLARVIVEAGLAIGLAFILHSVAALILAMIGAAFFEVVLSFIILPDKPRFAYTPARARVIFSNAKGLSVTSALTYLNENIDDFILGKTIGAYSLGLYHNAYALSHKTNYELAKAAHHSILPIFTKITHDFSRLSRAFLKSIGSTAAIMILASLPLFLFPEIIVKVLLGSQWLEIVPIVPVLALAGLLHGFSMICYSLFLANSQYRVMNLHVLASTLLLIPLVWWLSINYGLVGGAWAVVLARALSLPIAIIGVYKTIHQ